jgi:glutathione synthase
MTKRVLYITDPLTKVDPKGDSTLALMWESQQRGYENYFCEIHQLGLEGNSGFSLCRPFELNEMPDTELKLTWLKETTLQLFDDFDFIWMRKDPPVDQAFMTATMILDHHHPKKTWVVNNPSALRIANEKLWAHFASDLFPRTIVSADAKTLTRAAAEMKKVVLKPIDAAGGYGIFIFSYDDRNLKSAIEVLSNRGKDPIIVQEYLPEIQQGDKRVLLLGGECMAGLKRMPGNTDHRANLHVGGTAAIGSLDATDRSIAARLKPHLLDLGLHFVGIDLIGQRLTEVNVTSPTGIREINQLEQRSGTNLLEAQIWDYLERNKN